MKLEELKDQLAERATSRNAWVAYEFDARKRLDEVYAAYAEPDADYETY